VKPVFPLLVLAVVAVCAAAIGADPQPPAPKEQIAAAEEAEAPLAVAEIARRALERSPRDPVLWEKRAAALATAGEWERCIAVLDEWERTLPKPSVARAIVRGDAAMATGKLDEAIAAWNQAIRLRKSDPALIDKLANALGAARRWKEAAELRERRVKLEPTAAAYVELTIARLRLRDWTRAKAAINRANEIDATATEVQQLLPKLERLLSRTGEIDRATRAWEANRSDIGPLIERTILFYDQDWMDFAAQDADEAFAADQESVAARVLKGSLSSRLGQLSVVAELGFTMPVPWDAQAIRELHEIDRGIRDRGATGELLGRRALVLTRVRQWDLAARYAEEALKLDPSVQPALAARGVARAETRKKIEALSDFTEATRLNPDDWGAWLWRGRIEMEAGAIPAAIESFNRVLALNANVAALQSREQCYRALSRNTEADADAARIRQLAK
jgi:tetratricopeptide (TPR) repeat protein